MHKKNETKIVKEIRARKADIAAGKHIPPAAEEQMHHRPYRMGQQEDGNGKIQNMQKSKTDS